MKQPRALFVSGRTGFNRVTCSTTMLWVLVSALNLQGQSDPGLNLDLQKDPDGVVIRWLASNAVPYRVEMSSNLTQWIELGQVITGAGATVAFTNGPVGQASEFYRVKRLTNAGVVTASFNPGTGILTITGDGQPNVITVDRGAPGVLRVNNGSVFISGGPATVANTVLVQVIGGDGNDYLALNEANGALPQAQLQGDAGDDTLTGGSGPDVLTGGTGNDTLRGRGGSDSLLGGEDNDIVEGGDGDDTAALGPGNDRFIWNPGDDIDTVDGDEDTDLVEVHGGNGAEQFSILAIGTRVRFDRLDPDPFLLDIGTCEFLVLNANGGDDTFTASGNLAALIQLTVDGGPGNDTLLGSNGPDLLLGGDDNDVLDGNQGGDTVFGGANDDTFVWDPGDGNDTLEGQAGNDTLVFNGSNASEIIELLANGARLRLTRNVGSVVMDADGVEQVSVNALGGADILTVNILTATAVTLVNLDLAATGGIDDAQPDIVTLPETSGPDTFNFVANTGAIEASGFGPIVRVYDAPNILDSVNVTGVGSDLVNINGSAAADTMTVTVNGTVAQASTTGFPCPVSVSGALTLRINGLGGSDHISCTGNLAAIVPLVLDGGDDNDTILGGNGGDTINGGAGEDTLDGNQGADTVYGGADDDTFVWDPGDGNDTLEGQAGNDTLVFNGSNASEIIELLANGARLRLTRNVGSIVMDADGVEQVSVNALGGADILTVNSLTGTAVTLVNLDLAATGGIDDAQPDGITINGTTATDVFNLTTASGAVDVSGLTPLVHITHPQVANDSLTLNGLAGTDTFNIGPGVTALISVTINQ